MDMTYLRSGDIGQLGLSAVFTSRGCVQNQYGGLGGDVSLHLRFGYFEFK